MTINFLNIAQVLVAVALIIFILIQRGPGATAGSAFGGGASGTVFGAKGSGSFLTKSTAILATLFFIITMLIDARDTYAASGEAANQDLGVIGTLDSDNQEPAMVPEGDGAIDVSGVIDAVEQAGDEVQQTAEQTGDAIKDAATDAQDVMVETADQAAQTVENAAEEVAEKIKETVDESDEDSDDGDQ